MASKARMDCKAAAIDRDQMAPEEVAAAHHNLWDYTVYWEVAFHPGCYLVRWDRKP
ncbi:hypothetical protein KSB_12460 [Ktedonobacter robiniae]|uniref:Uncharacterized protein n=1 Tax=Ktedonobacter robiniae TaxID=2778365 RepID=A0ABQ3UJ95_9CHLR|nr:hypothetical protein KSB_12460 [Ktedonobacter robiniae]